MALLGLAFLKLKESLSCLAEPIDVGSFKLLR
jgi:hypothetical protein